jgi:hypothetical protein
MSLILQRLGKGSLGMAPKTGLEHSLCQINSFEGSLGLPLIAEYGLIPLPRRLVPRPRLGIGCNPGLIKGEKKQFLDWLSWGVESEAIRFPAETGSIHWPSLSLQDLVLSAN